MPLAHLWSLLGWIALAGLCAALALSMALTRRSIALRLSVRYGAAPDSAPPVSELLLGAVAALLLGVVLFESAPATSFVLRLTWAIAGAGLAAAAGLWLVSALQDFAEARDAERREWRVRSAEAAAQISNWTDAPAVRAAACRALSHALAANDVRLYLLENGRYKLSYETAKGAAPESYAPDAPLVRLLKQQPEFRPYAFDDAGPRLAVPAPSGLDLAGFFIISGGPYCPAEQNFALDAARETVRSLAAAATLAKQVDARVSVQLERRELENTRRALQHLAAPDLPSAPGLDYAAEYWRGDRPGGQFLDIAALPHAAIGFVLASLPGIGLDAAIRMAQLQTLLRSRFWAYAEDLPELLQSTERALRAARHTAAPIQLFAARCLPESRKLTYVNAGALPPLLIRRGGEGAQVLRLAETGPPLLSGAAEAAHPAEVTLESGDLLAIVNQGLTEALSPAGEPWGEGRLIETLLAWESNRANDLVSLTLRTVEEHTAHQLSAPDRAMILIKAL